MPTSAEQRGRAESEVGRVAGSRGRGTTSTGRAGPGRTRRPSPSSSPSRVAHNAAHSGTQNMARWVGQEKSGLTWADVHSEAWVAGSKNHRDEDLQNGVVLALLLARGL